MVLGCALAGGDGGRSGSHAQRDSAAAQRVRADPQDDLAEVGPGGVVAAEVRELLCGDGEPGDSFSPGRRTSASQSSSSVSGRVTSATGSRK